MRCRQSWPGPAALKRPSGACGASVQQAGATQSHKEACGAAPGSRCCRVIPPLRRQGGGRHSADTPEIAQTSGEPTSRQPSPTPQDSESRTARCPTLPGRAEGGEAGLREE